MHKLLVVLALTLPWGAAIACSDDDGSDVEAKALPGAGAGGGAGTSGAGAGGRAGRGGAAAGGTDAGGDAGTSAGSPGCSPTRTLDAGLDAGASDAGLDSGVADAGLDAGLLEVGDGGSELSDIVSFAADIHPIFEASCGPCHVDLGYGGHNVGGELDAAYQDAVALGQRLVTRIDGGGMPPPNAAPPNACGADGRGSEAGDPGCLTVAEVALVKAWIEQCFPR